MSGGFRFFLGLGDREHETDVTRPVLPASELMKVVQDVAEVDAQRNGTGAFARPLLPETYQAFAGDIR